MIATLSLMQDGASGHTAASTKQKLQERSIRAIPWPAYSPDLNPIETVWDEMKELIQETSPKKLDYDRLKDVVTAVWRQIPKSMLNDLCRFYASPLGNRNLG